MKTDDLTYLNNEKWDERGNIIKFENRGQISTYYKENKETIISNKIGVPISKTTKLSFSVSIAKNSCIGVPFPGKYFVLVLIISFENIV